jgi:hypothetical protein
VSALTQLITALEATRDETLSHFDLGDDLLERRYAPAKWSVRFILQHLSDSETVFFERLRRTIAEPRPVVWVYDQDAWAAKLDYGRRPLSIARDVFGSARNAIIELARVHYERDGHLEFVHSVTGVHTLTEELDRVASHNAEHLGQIRRALTR